MLNSCWAWLQASLLLWGKHLEDLRYKRLDYLKVYEDDAIDEFVETYRCNNDGTSSLDDSFFYWIRTRHTWRDGAEKYEPSKEELATDLTDDQLKEKLEQLQDYKSIDRPLPLSDVVEYGWELWRKDPDFPDQDAIDELGMDELWENGHRWIDGKSLHESFGGASSYYDEGEEASGSLTVLPDDAQFSDLQ